MEYQEPSESFLGKASGSSKGDTGKDSFFPSLSLLHLDEEPGTVAAILFTWRLLPEGKAASLRKEDAKSQVLDVGVESLNESWTPSCLCTSWYMR